MDREALFGISGAARILRVASNPRSPTGAAARGGHFERSRVWGRVAKILSAVTAPLLLAGCFLTPGAFESSLDLRRGGDFTFAYKGEVVFTIPDEMTRRGASFSKVPWSDDKAYCSDDDRKAAAKPSTAAPIVAVPSSESSKRPCTASEIAAQKKAWEEEQVAAAKREGEESKNFASIFGYAPGDDEANRRLAAQLAKYEGFRSAVYAGNGVFNVDYVKSGRLSHDFVFPVMMQGNVMFPFVLVRPQTDGAVRVSAPAYVGNGALGALARLKDSGMGGELAKLPANRTKGRFVLTTDGEVLTNNTEDGPVAGPRGKVLTWLVDAKSAVVPEALVRLK